MSNEIDRAKHIEELSSIIVNFLPGPAPGYPVVPGSFQGIARELELQNFWRGSSKVQSVQSLLDAALEQSAEKFSLLLQKILEHAKKHLSGGSALSIEDLERIRSCVTGLDLSLPELFSESLSSNMPERARILRQETQAMKKNIVDLNSRMRKELVALTMNPADEQGYELEVFLNKLFANAGMRTQAPFRQREMQIRGSFQLNNQKYELHAFWEDAITLLAFESIIQSAKVSPKSLIVSLRGFGDELKEYLQSSKNAAVIAVDLRDLFLVLDGAASLEQMISLKTKFAEQGRSLVPAEELLWA
jgi:hypothetical protein